MKLQTQKISREMNFTTKVRSICTDKSMKNSRVHHWNCSVCTDEQVNCPFCLLWERCLKPIFPRRISQPYALGKKNQLWKTQKQISLACLCINFISWAKMWFKNQNRNRKADFRSWVGHIVSCERLWKIWSPSKYKSCRPARGPEPITTKHTATSFSLQMHFNGISLDDPEARCHWFLNNFLEASSGHYGNYLYVKPLKDMSTHGTSRQPAP